MKKKKLLLITAFFAFGCITSKESLDSIFSNRYEYKMISRGDNGPDFNIRKDSLGLFLVALHEDIDPKDFQKKVKWSDEVLQNKIQFLKEKNWLHISKKGLKPSLFIVSNQEGIKLMEYGKPIAEKIATSIESVIPSIKVVFQTNGLSSYYFDSLSFLILSNVLLDNWQIKKIEKAYLGKDNRPERHGKYYYTAIMENTNYPKEGFGIYGNQFGSIYDSTYLSIYGNNRSIANDYLANDSIFRDSVLNIAPLIRPELYQLFDEISDNYRTTLVKILNNQTDYAHKVYEKTGYSDEITYDEFFIWWYHFIYTKATNILAERGKLQIPAKGNFYYRVPIKKVCALTNIIQNDVNHC